MPCRESPAAERSCVAMENAMPSTEVIGRKYDVALGLTLSMTVLHTYVEIGLDNSTFEIRNTAKMFG